MSIDPLECVSQERIWARGTLALHSRSECRCRLILFVLPPLVHSRCEGGAIGMGGHQVSALVGDKATRLHLNPASGDGETTLPPEVPRTGHLQCSVGLRSEGLLAGVRGEA